MLVGWGMSLNEAKQGKNLRRCYHHPGQVSQGATVTLTCERIYPARYVMIDKAPNTDVLTLCEVEIYAEPKANGNYDLYLVIIINHKSQSTIDCFMNELFGD